MFESTSDVLRPEAEAVLQVSKLLTAMDVPEPAMWSDLRSIARKCAEIFECDDQRLLHESFPMMQQYNELGAPKREVAFEFFFGSPEKCQAFRGFAQWRRI